MDQIGQKFWLSKHTEAVAKRCSTKIMFWKMWQNSQENNSAGLSSLIKNCVQKFNEKILWHEYFPVNFT